MEQSARILSYRRVLATGWHGTLVQSCSGMATGWGRTKLDIGLEVSPSKPADQLGKQLGKDPARVEKEEDGHKDDYKAVDQE